MSPADRFIPRLAWSKKTGPGRWIARCPAHKDRSPSLAISEKSDTGALLIHCHAECEPADIVGAVGLRLADLYPPRSKSYRPPDRTALHAADVLTCLGDDLTFAYVVMNDFHRYLADESQGQPPGPATRALFLKATEHVLAGAALATGRHVRADEERRAIIHAGVLTEAEEVDLREFASA